jgi:ribosomal protein S18 acetylase RimI-like enzyme
MAIRSYRPDDLDAVYEICLRTGDAGSDASHLVSDPDLPGHVYAGPYLALCPELAFVLDDDGAVAGYVIGALDTRAFADAYRERWPSFPEHPSHLHVNLLPGAQGRGQGRALVETICDALRAAGSPGVHLGVQRRNERAVGFYARAGFEQLHDDADAVFFGRALRGD